MSIENLPIVSICLAVISLVLCAWLYSRQRQLRQDTADVLEALEFVRGRVSDRLMEHYFGPIGSDRRNLEEMTLKKYSGRTRMGSILFQIHHHGDNCTDDEIVYKEKDVILLLEQLGFSVKFGEEL